MSDEYDLIVIGAGVMGLFTAYHASADGARVAVLERGTVGDPRTASFGRTRSYRTDYLDPLYVRLAMRAIELWDDFEQATGTRALVRCGCMNIATTAVTPDLAHTYGQLAADVTTELGLPLQTLDRAALSERYAYLDADLAHLDPAAGLVDQRAVTDALLTSLAARSVDLRQGVTTSAVSSDAQRVHVTTDVGDVVGRALVITAGHGTNDVLELVAGTALRVPITRDRPSEAKYFTPPLDRQAEFSSDAMPVIAYLDTGVYVHPMVDGVIDKVKIGYYNPPDIPRDRTGVRDITDFVARCMPGLADATFADVAQVDDVDQCDYDLVDDDDFVLGAVPGVEGVYVGVGWRGTGYKFAPWVGRTLADLALHARAADLPRFDPARFVKELA